MGLPGQARTHHHDALGLARQTGVRHEQARAHDGLGSAYHATGGHDQARHHWQQALALYTGLGVPAARRVSGKLSALAPGDPAAGGPEAGPVTADGAGVSAPRPGPGR